MNDAQKIVAIVYVISNPNGKTAAEIMERIKDVCDL